MERFRSRFWSVEREVWVERRHAELQRGHVRVVRVSVWRKEGLK